jgi:GNAT superfamily N-acetyltransferase
VDEVVDLGDGQIVEMRPMRPDDADRLVRFHRHLSPDTTYLRFFSPHPELSAREVDGFTHVDHVHREALVATLDGEIVGVGRFSALADPTVAEVAFAVTDAWHHRGIGRMLFEGLARRAEVVGIRRFTAETLWQNRPMLALFEDVGRPVRTSSAEGVVHVEIDLQDEPASPA